MAAYARRLACDLIRDQFGELVQKVCECLVQRGSLLLSEIARLTGIDVAPLGECLKLLIQHNCVQAFRVMEQEEDGAAAFGVPVRHNTFYMPVLDNILHRMRFPKFLKLVREDIGKEAEELVSAMLQHGRLTLEQLLKRAADCAQSTDIEVELSVRKAFVDLVAAHYIERCPLPEPALEGEEQPQQKRLRTATLPMQGLTQMQDEQRVLAAAAQADAQRFQLPASLLAFSTHTEESEISLDDSGSQERKELDALAAEKDVIWRVNYDEFLRRLRHQVCVRLLRNKTDLGCGTVLSSILDGTRTSERTVKDKLSRYLEIGSVVHVVRNTEEGRGMSTERIHSAILQMATDGFVSRTADDQYAINMERIITVARQTEIENIVFERFGRKCCRIFRLLSVKGHLEHKQVSDRSLVPFKETWELLYKLVKEHFVELEEAEDPNSARALLWRVEHQKVIQRVLNQMYQAAWNVSRRLAQELEQDQEHQEGDAVGADEQAQASRRRNIARVLDASLSKLDDTIMLFHDF